MRTLPRPKERLAPEHALHYLRRADDVPHRIEGEAVLCDFIPMNVGRVLDLGTRNGHLLAMLRTHRPIAEGVALDFSPTMLRVAQQRFRDAAKVTVLEHDLDEPLPDPGRFDAVVSSFAIHHLSDARKRALCSETHAALVRDSIFCNLEHVATASAELHQRFLRTLGITDADEDPSNQRAPMEVQFLWLREI